MAFALGKMCQDDLGDGRLTIVLPTYNHGHLINQAIDSLYAQTRKPDRIIVLDDGSTDETATVVRQYDGQTPPIEYIRGETNKGVVAMLNRGLALVDTEFVSFLAADDFVRPDLYVRSLDILKLYAEAAVCGVNTTLIAEDGSPLKSPRQPGLGTTARYVAPAEAVERLLRFGGLFGGNGAVYRVVKLRALHGFSAELLSFCDGYAMQVLAARHGVCVIPDALAVWRISRTSFAAQSQLNASTCWSILKAVECRRTQEGASFPAAYQDRLESRLRFAAAVAAVCEPDLNMRVLADVLPNFPRRWFALLALAKRIGRRPLILAIMGLWFRPFDILPTLWHRASAKT